VRGTVTESDDDKGFGTVRADDVAAADKGSAVEYFFHCTAIADGSRTIAVGTPVEFDVVAGHLGRYEAADVQKCSE
jgi:cold shock CspA family protein